MRFLIILLCLSAFQGIIAQVDHVCKEHFSIADHERQQHFQRATFRSNPLTHNYDLRYHRLEWEVDPAVNYITGSVTSYFVPTETNFQQLNFDLAQNMSINAITYHGSDLLGYTQTSDNILQIDLPAVIGLGQLDSITISYEGEPSSNGFGSFETSTHDGTPVLWTLSEPYGARDWWPCKQDLNDKIDSIDVLVTTPSAYRVASNGLLVKEQNIDNNKLYHWKHRYPIPAYLIAIAVTNYAVFSDFVQLNNGDSIEVLNYVYPEDLDRAINNLVNTIRIMEFFNDFFGDYPFDQEKYGHAQFSWPGGMEHQTMSFMGGFNYGLQAHELAHQWFGNKITCGSWEDIWLNEGFATYLTGISYEFVLVGEIWWDEWKRVVIERVTSEPGGSVFVTDTTDVSRIFDSRLSYSKGSYLLHMLRWKLGDDDFFQALRNYVNDPRLAWGYARTNDLKAHLEQQSGEDLTQYFQDWFYGEGFPSYHLRGELTSSGINLTVNQTSSHPSVTFYAMPIPVQLKGEGQDTIVRLDHTFSGQEFNIDLSFEVDSIEFDPDMWILSANNTVDFMTTGTAQVDQLEQAIRLQPNPFQDQLQLFIDPDGPAIDQIKVYNAQGQLVRQCSGGAVSTTSINTTDWPAGVYLVNFYSKGKQLTKEVVKGL